MGMNIKIYPLRGEDEDESKVVYRDEDGDEIMIFVPAPPLYHPQSRLICYYFEIKTKLTFTFTII